MISVYPLRNIQAPLTKNPNCTLIQKGLGYMSSPLSKTLTFNILSVIGGRAMTTKTITYSVQWEKEMNLTWKDKIKLLNVGRYAYEATSWILELI